MREGPSMPTRNIQIKVLKPALYFLDQFSGGFRRLLFCREVDKP